MCGLATARIWSLGLASEFRYPLQLPDTPSLPSIAQRCACPYRSAFFIDCPSSCLKHLVGVEGNWYLLQKMSSSLLASLALQSCGLLGFSDVSFRWLCELSYITMIKSIVIACLLFVALISEGVSESHEEIGVLCHKIGVRLEGIQLQMKRQADQMNKLLSVGHIQIKDQYAAKPQEITKISRNIQTLAKQMQKIYDDRNYLRFCLVFNEEKQYKEHNSTQINEAEERLKQIFGGQTQDL